MKHLLRIFLLYIFSFAILALLLNVTRIYVYARTYAPVTLSFTQKGTDIVSYPERFNNTLDVKLKLRFAPPIALNAFKISLKTDSKQLFISRIDVVASIFRLKVPADEISKFFESDKKLSVINDELAFDNIGELTLGSKPELLVKFNVIKYSIVTIGALLLSLILNVLWVWLASKLNKASHDRLLKWIVATGFCLVLLLPHLSVALGVKDLSTDDNRALATAPVFMLPSMNQFPQLYESYFNDNFGMRNYFIRAYYRVKFALFSSCPLSMQNNSAFFGKEGFLFYKENNEYQDIRAKAPFRKDELLNLKEKMLQNQEYLAKKNIKFYILISPNKSSIYTDKLPDYHKYSFGVKHRTDQFVDMFKDEPQIKILDLRNVINSKKNSSNELLYFKTDTHWNDLGGFYAYNALMDELDRDFGVNRLQQNNIKMKNEVYVGDLVKILGLRGLISENIKKVDFKYKSKEVFSGDYYKPEEHVDIHKFVNSNARSPKILMMRDSFGDAMIPYLRETFSESIFIWKYNLDKKLVEAEKPDIVVLQVVERFLDGI